MKEKEFDRTNDPKITIKTNPIVCTNSGGLFYGIFDSLKGTGTLLPKQSFKKSKEV